MIKREAIEAYLIGNTNLDLSGIFQWTNIIHDCITELSQDKWVSVDSKPVCEFEATEWDDSGEICTFDGWVSNTVHVSDGSSIGMGHYKDDGTWRVYEGEFDCMMPDPDKITHWKPLELPNDK